MANMKFIKKSFKEINDAVNVGRLFSHSEKNTMSIIQEFNRLSFEDRRIIRNEWERREAIMKAELENQENNDNLYEGCVFVEMNIVASIFEVDPGTVAFIVSKVCTDKQKIMVKK